MGVIYILVTYSMSTVYTQQQQRGQLQVAREQTAGWH